MAERAQAERDEAKERLIAAKYRGEAIMREFLSLLVDSKEYVDDADPGFLVNPETLGKLQLDRYYAKGIGFEFQGPQHDHPTESFTEEDVARQQARDFMKLGMCVKLGITLVEVRPEELSLKTMQQKVGKLLPLRDLTGHEQLVGFLERVARGYRPKSARWVPRQWVACWFGTFFTGIPLVCLTNWTEQRLTNAKTVLLRPGFDRSRVPTWFDTVRRGERFEIGANGRQTVDIRSSLSDPNRREA